MSDGAKAKGLWTFWSGKCMCVSFFCTCRSHSVFPPGLYMYMCPSLNVALCVPFLDNALHIQKRQPVGIWKWNTLTSCMTLLISSLFGYFLFVETLTFLWGVCFFFFFVLEITLPDVKINQRKRGNMFDLHETSVLTRLKNQNLILSILSPPFFVLVITCYCFIFSVFCYLVPKTNFHHVLRCPSYKSLVPYVCVSCITAWALHAGVSLSFSLSLFLFLPFLSSFLPFSSLFFCTGNACAVECSSCVFSLSPPFSLCRGCAVPDGWGPQTDPSAARGDGWYSKLKGFLAVWLNTTALSIKVRLCERLDTTTSYCSNNAF